MCEDVHQCIFNHNKKIRTICPEIEYLNPFEGGRIAKLIFKGSKEI